MGRVAIKVITTLHVVVVIIVFISLSNKMIKLLFLIQEVMLLLIYDDTYPLYSCPWQDLDPRVLGDERHSARRLQR